RAMKSTSATWRSSFRMRSPPRSPSTKAVSARSFESSWIVFGTFVPSTAIAFLIPERRRFGTSWRPSTMMIAALSAAFGPAGRRQDRSLDLVQRGRDQDRAFAASFLALDVDLDSADAAALLQVPQVQFLAEEPFRLAEHGPDDVGLLDDPFRLQAGLDEIFSRTRIDVHFHTCPGEL